MRILYLSLSPIPSRAANSVQVVKNCAAMVQQGHQVTLFGATGGSEPITDYYGVETPPELFRHPLGRVPLVSRSLFGRRTANQARTLLDQTDLIYGRDIYALLALGNTSQPQIYEAHMPPANATKRHLHRRLFSRKSFFRLITVSRALADYYRENFPELAHKEILVAPNGADLPHSIEVTGESSIRKPAVGYAGQLHAHKGPGLILSVARRMPGIPFHIVGGSPEDIQKWSAQAPKNVVFHGQVSQQELGKYYRTWPIFLAPYQESACKNPLRDDTIWGSPLKVFEYMAHGCCFIASDLPIIREIVGSGSARLCNPSRPEEWEQTLRTLLEDPRQQDELSRTARKLFLERFTREARVRHILSGVLPDR
ncbi:Glycosyltransferase involved in cell wall bisynthesis [Alkalispirochaeta americana]|uniref:Glycosyltransferase involved in cell wall bisynthesis n=1 Tax=Alkalispirochaeta americana TaxID=159291 RepID=A0A1N6RUT7_9SPIO|nr:glycosyltransferase family 4 protein [Alkalispirochaeta americana]SIQ32561.1 Glycosyltransferase involved in cell wall bisynthesis [Alkalispirochaeta americana]